MGKRCLSQISFAAYENDESRMTNVERSPNAKMTKRRTLPSFFGFRHSFVIRHSSFHSFQRANPARVKGLRLRPQRDSSRLEVCRRKKLNSRLRKNRAPGPRVKAGCARLPGELAPSAVRFVLPQSNEPARKCRLPVDRPAVCPASALNN